MKTRNIILGFAILSILVRLLIHEDFGFHRDEYLYLALGQHPAFGYWSNAPLVGFFSFVIQQTLGDGFWAFRFIPVMLGAATIFLTGRLTEEMGGGRFAVFLSCFLMLLSPAFLRVFSMYMPVCFTVFFWTLFAFLMVKYINTGHRKYLLWLGLAIGLGLLNKYSVIFYIIAIFAALLLTKHRSLLKTRAFYGSLLLCFIIVSPNLIWQYQNNFPVFHHMNALSETQLVHVSPLSFLTDQFFMYLPAILIWLAGLYYLLFVKKGKTWIILGWIYVALIVLMLIFKGKSYYILGAYPPLIAAGSIYFEQLTEAKSRRFIRAGYMFFAVATVSLLLPFCNPFLSVEACRKYCLFMVNKVGLEMPVRWEDGRIYELPQDYADMLGWEQLAVLVHQALQQVEDPEKLIIYGENYGQAGATAHHGKKYDLPEVFSFNDSFRMWLKTYEPDEKDVLIYINDELGEDVSSLFENIEITGTVQTAHARTRGTNVYLCRRPRQDLSLFWNERVNEVLAPFR